MSKPENPVKSRRVGYGPVAAVVVTIGVYFGAQLFVGLLISLLPAINGWETEQLQEWLKRPEVQFTSMLAIDAVILWLVWLFLKSRQVSLKKIGLIKPRLADIFYAIAIFALYVFVTAVVNALVQANFPGLDNGDKQALGFSTDIQGLALLLAFVGLVILPPVTEEIVTRGLLYTGLRSKLAVIPAALVTSVLFAAAHLNGGVGDGLLWLAGIDIFVFSLFLVYLREKTGSLWSPIMVHSFKNGLAFALLFIWKVA